MRKIKIDLQCRVPSWNFCNHDGHTPDDRYSKELCRFCIKTKQGYRCTLHEQWLTSDPTFVHKAPACIKATAGFAVTADEPTPNAIPPKTIIKQSIKNYKKTVNDLITQGYPRAIAEAAAEVYILEE